MADTELKLRVAVLAWWEENRPLGWAEEDHVAQATVNCETDAEQALARLAAHLVRATPPSPSTAPEVDERAAFEAWSKRVAPAHEIERDSFDQYVSYPVHAGWAAWTARAALASRPAEVDDEGLPPLPEGTPVMHIADETGSGSRAYTAEQYRQGQRDAVAADRARRGDINPEDAFVLYSAADVIDECGKVLVALKVRGIADRVIMPEITKAPR